VLPELLPIRVTLLILCLPVVAAALIGLRSPLNREPTAAPGPR
jgi:hypothetical protein